MATHHKGKIQVEKEKPRKGLIKRLGKNNNKLFGLHASQGACSPEAQQFLRQCFNYIEKTDHIEGEGIYRKSGEHAKILKLRAMVDKSPKDFLIEIKEDVHTITGLVKLYFREMPEPIVPYDLYGPCMAASTSPEEVRDQMIANVLQLLRPSSRSILSLLCYHLNKVSSFSEINLMSAKNLAIIFAPNLLRPSNEDISSMLGDAMSSQALVQCLVENPKIYFTSQPGGPRNQTIIVPPDVAAQFDTAASPGPLEQGYDVKRLKIAKGSPSLEKFRTGIFPTEHDHAPHVPHAPPTPPPSREMLNLVEHNMFTSPRTRSTRLVPMVPPKPAHLAGHSTIEEDKETSEADSSPISEESSESKPKVLLASTRPLDAVHEKKPLPQIPPKSYPRSNTDHGILNSAEKEEKKHVRQISSSLDKETVTQRIDQARRARAPSKLEVVLGDLEQALIGAQAAAQKDLSTLESIKTIIFQKKDKFIKDKQFVEKAIKLSSEERKERGEYIDSKISYLDDRLKVTEEKVKVTTDKLKSIDYKLEEIRKKKTSLKDLPSKRKFSVYSKESSDAPKQVKSVETIDLPNIDTNDFESALEELWKGFVNYGGPQAIQEGLVKQPGFFIVNFTSPEEVIETWNSGKSLPLEFHEGGIELAHEISQANEEFMELIKSHDATKVVCFIITVQMKTEGIASTWGTIDL